MQSHDHPFPAVNDLSQETVTSCFACGPPIVTSPQEAAELLFSKPLSHLRSRVQYEILEHEITDDELDVAARFGRFPYRPSNLFLKLFHNALCTLRRDSLAGGVSPSLIGSSGVIPLTIISTIPDIMQHYYHCIVHAQQEVLLATNYWEKSASVTMIGKALRELSKRAGREHRHVIVKLMIDHPTKENILHFHSLLPPSKWSDYDIPQPEEIPHLFLEVNNYHRIVMGTFHAKFMVVDRRIALLNSNNIQDRPNLEMMSHFEGDIVNSFYDTYLISWWLPFQPNLVCLKDPAPANDRFAFGIDNTKFFSVKQPLREAVARARLRLQCHLESEESEVYLHIPSATSDDDDVDDNDGFSNVAVKALAHHRHTHSAGALVRSMNHLIGGAIGYDMAPRAESPLTHRLNQSSKSARSTKPDESLSTEELDKLAFDFSPFIFHQEQQPYPIALVNRLPYGTPGHTDTANPQAAAWMGAFRYAQKSIFIQSPTLNASPAIDGILAACRRGVVVTLWLDLGFNDLMEGHITLQGGTNEHVVKKLYRKLRDDNDGAEKFLEVFWYTGKGNGNPSTMLNLHC